MEDSPAKKVESPAKKAAENGSAKNEEDVKENGASEEEEEDVEKEQNGDNGKFGFTFLFELKY